MPDPPVIRADKDWTLEVWRIGKLLMLTHDYTSETTFLKDVYLRLCPQMVAYGKLDPVLVAKVAPMLEGAEINAAELKVWYLAH